MRVRSTTFIQALMIRISFLRSRKPEAETQAKLQQWNIPASYLEFIGDESLTKERERGFRIQKRKINWIKRNLSSPRSCQC